MIEKRKMKRTLRIGKGNMATVDDFTAPVYEVSSHEQRKDCIKNALNLL